MTWSSTRRWSALGSRSTVCSVVTIGIRRSRSRPDDVAAGRAAEDAVLVLEADDVGVGEVQEVGRPEVASPAPAPRSRTGPPGIVVPLGTVVDRHDEALGAGKLGRDRGAHVVVNVAIPHLRGR